MHTDVLPFPFSPLPAIFTGRDRTTRVVSRFSGRKQATCFFFFFFLAFKNKRIFGGEFEIRIRFIIGFVICDLKWMYNI